LADGALTEEHVQVADTCRRLANAGLVIATAGNVSVRRVGDDPLVAAA
jgi:ribulose-5-phosphate 4-epimerase/fuculose-1-phosphate aldolase